MPTQRFHMTVLVTIVIICVSAAAADEPVRQSNRFSQRVRAQSLNRDASFSMPPETESGYSSTNVDLRVTEAVNTINGVELQHRAYNGRLVGPTIRLHPGTPLNVRLINNLRYARSGTHSPNIPHGFNITNLHTHGLHVSPQSPADDVFMEIGPGEAFDFEFDIPADHPAGTFWYHAHKHGSTALQLASGLSGALIVEGGLDEIPEIRAARERIMVLQQFTYREVGGQPAFVDPDLLYSGDGDFVEAINGVVTPTVIMRPGEIQRWRLIHAGTAEAIRLDAEGVNFFEVAVDGLATGRMDEKNSIELYPGNRSDVLVKAPETKGTRLVYSLLRDADAAISRRTLVRRNVLRIVIKGEPVEMAFPGIEDLEAVAAFDNDDVPSDHEIVRRRTLTFSRTAKAFLIDGKEFDPDNIAQCLQLGTAEEWELISESGVHPFHIHVNPFAVKPKVEGDPWIWRDTIVVKKRQPVIIRMRFQEYTGKTVLHCHNLIHEDQGMMQAIQIVGGKRRKKATTHAATSRNTAPHWTAWEQSGKKRSSREFEGQLSMVVFHRGMECLHCAEQLNFLKEQYDLLQTAGVRLVAISQYVPTDEEAAKVIADYPFPVLVDPDLGSFRSYKCIGEDGEALHGVFLVDGDRRLLLERRTEIAITDPVRLVTNVLDNEYSQRERK